MEKEDPYMVGCNVGSGIGSLQAMEREYDRLGLEEEYTEFLGNKVVCHSIPIRPGRNLAVICEAAAVNYRQKKMGYNAAQEIYNRVTNNIMNK